VSSAVTEELEEMESSTELQTSVDHRTQEAGVVDIANTQVLYFNEEFGQDDIRLLELTPDLLQTLKEEKTFVLRGDVEEDTVLCTSSKSYTLRETTTSNSLLLLPGLHYDKSESEMSTASVSGIKWEYYELKLCRAKLDKMRALLTRAAYRGAEEEEVLEESRMSLSDLLEEIQASEEEIRRGLDEMGAIELNGFWRLIEHDYQTTAMSRLLTLLEEKEWSWEKVPLIEACNTLAELQPQFVTELCARLYGNQVEETEEEVYMKLEESKVCRFYGQYILSSSSGNFNYSEFIDVWQDSVPSGMQTEIGQLQGMALTDTTCHPPSISYLPVSDLPVDPASRFSFLFERRERWNHKDLIPYIEDLAGPGQTVNSLLLKHCRSTTNHATKEKVYNSKART